MFVRSVFAFIEFFCLVDKYCNHINVTENHFIRFNDAHATYTHLNELYTKDLRVYIMLQDV